MPTPRRAPDTPLTLVVERVPTPVGTMLVLTDTDDLLRAVDWDDYTERMHRLLRLHYGEHGVQLREGRAASPARRALEAYLDGELGALDRVRAETAGTPFQREVWRALRDIPPGTTLSYGALALRIGRPAAVRAVGLANGANPVGVVVPCHRVIGANASLTGYGGGLSRKRWLLAHEGVATA
ncbi:MAG: methylated-DNA--[protein]-cysteine S-methyltransferase [Polyangiales bacterium]